MAVHGFLVLRERAVEIVYPLPLQDDVEAYFPLQPSPPAGVTPSHRWVIEVDGPGTFRVSSSRSEAMIRHRGLAEALCQVMVEAHGDLIAGFGDDALLLRAAGVARGDRVILIPGQERTGKSTLAAWLTEKGFRYLSDQVVAVRDGTTVEGLVRPLVVRPDAWSRISRFSWVARNARFGDGRQIVAPPACSGQAGGQTCGLILFVDFQSGAPPRLERLSRARASTLLMACNGSASDFADHGLSIVTALAAGPPILRLRYGSLDQIEAAQLDGVLGRLSAFDQDAGSLEAAISEVNAAFQTLSRHEAAALPAPIPILSPLPGRSPGDVTLTIGMATYDDYDGVYFTIQALRLYHPEVLSNTEIVVIDNHPDGICAEPLKKLMTSVPHGRHVPYLTRSGTSVRNRLFEEARGSVVLCLDCHVLLVPGAIARLLAYVRQHPETGDLLQGPLLHDDLTTLASHWIPVWRGGMWGIWGDDLRAHYLDTEPFEIPMQGLGAFACRKEAWLGFNAQFRGFGGEEGYIHEKFRQAGHRTLCLPFLRWVHRFARPLGAPYANRLEDRVHNYLVGFAELGLPASEMRAHYDQFMGAEASHRIFTLAYQMLAQSAAERGTAV